MYARRGEVGRRGGRAIRGAAHGSGRGVLGAAGGRAREGVDAAQRSRERARHGHRTFATEEDLRQGDETLNAMSPPGDGMGRRIAVETYEVAADLRMQRDDLQIDGRRLDASRAPGVEAAAAMARSWIARPVESNSVTASGRGRPAASPARTAPRS